MPATIGILRRLSPKRRRWNGSSRASRIRAGGAPRPTIPAIRTATIPYIHAMITDSRDYEGSVLAGDRDYAQKYYYGLLPTLDGDDQNPYSDTTIVQDPHATYERGCAQHPGRGQPLALRFDRRPRCGDDDAAEPDPVVRRVRIPGRACAAHRGRKRHGDPGDQLCKLHFLER